MKRLLLIILFLSSLCPDTVAQIQLRRQAIPNLTLPSLIQQHKGLITLHESFIISKDISAKLIPSTLSIDFASQCLPFFCRQEWKAEKSLRVPIRLRIGSMESSEWLEQKPNAVPPK